MVIILTIMVTISNVECKTDAKGANFAPANLTDMHPEFSGSWNPVGFFSLFVLFWVFFFFFLVL